MSAHQPRKRFGQHFLHDQSVLQKMIAAIHPMPDDHFVEIGPGKGALTDYLLETTSQLDIIEIDWDLVDWLKTHVKDFPHINIHQADALKFDYAGIATDSRSLRIAGNLPYNISTPLLFTLFSYADLIIDMYFLLQKEVVVRLTAAPGDHEYSRLSVMAQYYCHTELLFDVGPEAFTPPPKVNSAVIQMVPHKTLPHAAKDIKMLGKVVQTAFNQRRKMISNSLKTLIPHETLEALGIDPHRRPQELSVEEYVKIANALS